MSVRNKQSLIHAETVIGDVRDAVGELRGIGQKTVYALEYIAQKCGVAPRRVRTLFHRDQVFAVEAYERRALCLSIANMFDDLADEFERRADLCQQKADAIRLRERRQLELDFGGNHECRKGSGQVSQRLAA